MCFDTASTIFQAVFQLTLISLAAGILVKRKIVTQDQVQSMSAVTVTVFLPCLILANVITTFDPAGFGLWWTLPLAGTLLVFTGLFCAALLFGFKREKKSHLPMASMQNAVYITLPIGQILFPDQFDTFALYCFLLILGLTPLMWSIGKVLIAGTRGPKARWQDFVTPPLVATLAALFFVFTGLKAALPQAALEATALLGQATVPLAAFVLGATLAGISIRHMPPVRDLAVVCIVKYLILPGLTFAVLFHAGLHQSMPLFCSLMIIQASAPPATNLILIVKNYGGDGQAAGSMMLVQYLLCLPAMPVWLALWQMAAAP